MSIIGETSNRGEGTLFKAFFLVLFFELLNAERSLRGSFDEYEAEYRHFG